MASNNNVLLAEYQGHIQVLKYRYGAEIKEEEIIKYITATLHKYLPSDDAEAVLNQMGTIHRKYKLVHDLEDPNGLYKIYKVALGTLWSTETVIARFWVDSNPKDVSVKEFLNGPVQKKVEQPEEVIQSV